jgi:5-methylthioadenosine/S-adenosylhomocysteine deaminase
MTTMQTMIHHTTIVSVDDACTVPYDAAIIVEAGRIAATGPTDELLARYPEAERSDGRGKAVMPGFAHRHTHLTMILPGGIYGDLSPAHTSPCAGHTSCHCYGWCRALSIRARRATSRRSRSMAGG